MKILDHDFQCCSLNDHLHALFFRAGKPAPGLHLDVTKDGKMIQVCNDLHQHPSHVENTDHGCLTDAEGGIKKQHSKIAHCNVHH